MRSTRFSSLALALSLAAGLAASAHAASTLTVSAAKSGSTLSLNGASVYSTGAAISNQRLITLNNSTKVIAVWNETVKGATTSYFALSHDGTRFDQVLATDNKIKLRYAQFDPLANVPAVPEKLRATADNELFLVQFVATPLDEFRRDIAAAGGVVEAYLPENTHLVRMNAQTKAAVGALPYVRWVGACEPAYRLTEGLRSTLLAPAAKAVAVRYSIACLRDGPVQQNAVADAILAMGGIVEGISPDQFRMEATLTPEQLLAVVRRNEVGSIDPWGGPGGTDMDIARQIGGAVPLLSGVGFLGQGVRGEIFDTVANDTHIQWNIAGGGHGPLHHGVNGSSGSHGEATYGINFATGNGDLTATGMLPQNEAGIFFWYTRCSQFTAGQPTRLAMNIEATDPAGIFKSSYQSSSVGSAQIVNYDAVSQEVDDYLFKIDYLSCQSQSNTGNTTSRPQAWAKNIVSVGGVQHNNTLTRADDVLSGASFGPAQDGRVKPDLMHFYDSVHTTWTGNTYTEFSGTSGATPIVAGHFGLLMQMWHQGVWAGFGGGSTVFSDRPFGTTAKALMCNGAFRYPIAPFTRARQGWGMPDLAYLYNIRAKTFIVNADQPVQNAQTKSYSIVVGAAEPELRVTMCYIDPKPAGVALPNRVNDLSLKVTSPGGLIYWGNSGLGAGNTSTSGGVANTIDTVENVFLTNPQAGTWTVQVIGTSVAVDAYPTGKPGVVPVAPTDAGFSLVVTGGVAPVVNTCYPNCDGSTTAPILTANDFQCFLNSFAASASYANCDGSTSAPTLTANDFQCFLNAFAAGCS